MRNVKNKLRKILYANKVTKTICLWRIKLNNWYVIAYPFYKQKWLHPKATFLVMTPEHGNLGDHAIAKAETLLLKKNGIKYIEITGDEIGRIKEIGYLKLMNKRTILVQGGGYLGTLWPESEAQLREIIKNNPKSQIICLPNTIYYEDSEGGRQELQKSIEIYNAHSKLKLYAREETSYSLMSSIYNNVKLVPDIVLSLNYSDEKYERKGCLLCFRHDKEKTLLKIEEQIIYNQIKQIFEDKIKMTDMCTKYMIPINNRDNELDKKFNEFMHAELVVTDRLHAMIFCAITGTPCIVVNSKSPKVKGCYQWISSLEYIKFADDVAEISTLYQEIPRKRFVYNNANLKEYYSELEKDIVSVMNSR